MYELDALRGDAQNSPLPQTSNIRHPLVGNRTADHWPVGAAPVTSSFSTYRRWIGQRQLQDVTGNI